MRRGEAGQKRQTRQRLCCLWRLKRCMARANGSVYTMSEAAWEATMADVSLSDVKSLPVVMRARCKDYVACTESAVGRRVRRGEPCRSIHLIEHNRMCLPVASTNTHVESVCKRLTVQAKAMEVYAPVGVTVSKGLHVQLECPFQNWLDCTGMDGRGVPRPKGTIQVDNRNLCTHMDTSCLS